jgi:hypothetical protein
MGCLEKTPYYLLWLAGITLLSANIILELVSHSMHYQQVYLPFAHAFSFFVPLLLNPDQPKLHSALKDMKWVGLLGNTVFFFGQLGMLVVYIVYIFVDPTYLHPTPSSARSYDVKQAREVMAPVALGLVCIAGMIKLIRLCCCNGKTALRTAPQPTEVVTVAGKTTPADSTENEDTTLDGFLMILVWVVATVNVFVDVRALMTPVFVAFSAPNAVLTSAVMMWAYQRRFDSSFERWLLMISLLYGLSISIAAWIYDIQQTESVAVYMDIVSYKGIFGNGDRNQSDMFSNNFTYIVGSPLECALTTMYVQAINIMWCVIGTAVTTAFATRIMVTGV